MHVVDNCVGQQGQRTHLQTVDICFTLGAVLCAVVKISEPHGRVYEDDIVQKNYHTMNHQEREVVCVGVEKLCPTGQVEVDLSFDHKD